jgi:hypothetical protein
MRLGDQHRHPAAGLDVPRGARQQQLHKLAPPRPAPSPLLLIGIPTCPHRLTSSAAH